MSTRVVVDGQMPSGYIGVGEVNGATVVVLSAHDSAPTHARLLGDAGLPRELATAQDDDGRALAV